MQVLACSGTLITQFSMITLVIRGLTKLFTIVFPLNILIRLAKDTTSKQYYKHNHDRFVTSNNNLCFDTVQPWPKYKTNNSISPLNVAQSLRLCTKQELRTTTKYISLLRYILVMDELSSFFPNQVRSLSISVCSATSYVLKFINI